MPTTYKFPDDSPYSQTGDRKASTHKAWLEDVVTAIESLQRLIGLTMGGLTGVYAYGASPGVNSFKGTVTGADMIVTIGIGGALLNGIPQWNEVADSVSFSGDDPTSDPRIDLITWDFEAGAVNVETGVENASPSTPALPDNHIALVTVYHRVGETTIKSSDLADGNGYITDVRVRINF